MLVNTSGVDAAGKGGYEKRNQKPKVGCCHVESLDVRAFPRRREGRLAPPLFEAVPLERSPPVGRVPPFRSALIVEPLLYAVGPEPAVWVYGVGFDLG